MTPLIRSCSRLAQVPTRYILGFLRQSQIQFHTQNCFQIQAIAVDPQTVRIDSEPRNLPHALQLLDKIPQPDLTEYNHMLFDLSRNNRTVEALDIFFNMYHSGLVVDGSSLSCVLKVSGVLNDQIVGKQVHCHCIKSGFVVDVSVGTSLVDMYMKTKNVNDGRRIFDEMEIKNVVSWTSLLAGYTQNELVERALEVFSRMPVEGIKPNPFTFAAILGSLADHGMVEKGTRVHVQVIKNGFESSTFVGNSLVNMYSMSGMLREAKAVFDGMEYKDAVSWNGMVAGLVANGLHPEALKVFHQMRLEGIKLTQMIFAPAIKACATMNELSFTRQLHCRVAKSGFDFDLNIRTALMVAYNKCSSMDDALKIFVTMQRSQNVVSWTAMIAGYLQNGKKGQAVNLFLEMGRAGVSSNDFTYSAILTAHPCISPSQVHAQVIKTNYKNSPSVGTALLDAYAKTRNTDEAAKVFEIIGEKDIVAWSAMLAGFTQVGDTEGAINVFRQLTKQGISPNEFTFSSIMNACAGPVAAAEQGKQFHAFAIKSGFSDALCVSSALVTMYAKRGNIDSANEVFKRQGERDLVSWNSMISGYAQHGYGEKALKVFEEMQRRNIEMDGITFIGVISACTHAGLVDEGQKYFELMTEEHRLSPTMEHYACMVDLYSRAGKLGKAMNLINGMPFSAGATVWRTLLGACRVHRNVQMGKLAAEKLISLQPLDSAAYVLLSNIYVFLGW